MNETTFLGLPVEKDLKKFKDICDIIVANRLEESLSDVSTKVYTRDVFGSDT